MRTLALLSVAVALSLGGCSSPNFFEEATGPDCPAVEDAEQPGHQVPVYTTRSVPRYETRRTPIWGEKSVAVYQERQVPVTITLPDLCTGCDKKVALWDKTERIQVGVKRVRACIGFREERVQVGTCQEPVRVGWRTVYDDVPACQPCK